MAGRSADSYVSLLRSLLPRGKAWGLQLGGLLDELLHGFAQELSRVDAQVNKLSNERDSRFTNELLSEHETELDLPDECTINRPTTVEARRQAVHAKLLSLGGLNPQFYIDFASNLGYTITIDEFSPFICGLGDSGDSCGDSDIIFHWRVNFDTDTELLFFRSGIGASGDRIIDAVTGEDLLCFFNELKPAHTILIFRAVGKGYDRGYDRGFDSLRSDTEDFLTGGYSKGYGLGFDVLLGGGYEKDSYSNGYEKPS